MTDPSFTDPSFTDPISTDPQHPSPATAFLLHPKEVLLHLIATLLAPLFLTACDGDIRFARLAALETVNAYQARDQVDLIAIAQLVGCALAALGSIALSMEDGLSPTMTLRLRGNAATMNRSVEHARRALKDPRPTQAPQPTVDPDYQAAVLAQLAEAQKAVAEATARHNASQPQPRQTAAATPTPAWPTAAPNSAWPTAAPNLTPQDPFGPASRTRHPTRTPSAQAEASAIHLLPAQPSTHRLAALGSCAHHALATPLATPLAAPLAAPQPAPSHRPPARPPTT